ncbi:heme o synthase [Aureibacter tunicatorum]|uniref:Protoheme IX farnesyltransferase n=1 Tax=Aureibacter tunicatorum TaxID=866807 RepID=A0AAE3XJN9_9BACT|nr:heme o synthase [Aureibacter tunicatorum]MDR6238986.1 protoheme IX farnesyltransferase [Aureibacter tunicatorum]BDD05088.1 protoheme IX farnesyltransferase [Aureibacter tunicatorum]
MIATKYNNEISLALITAKAKDYLALLKFRLSFLVAFSSAFGYVIGTKGNFDWLNLMMLSLGGFLVSGASITLNQIQEKEYDKVMKRTSNRPLPTGRVSDLEAYIYAALVGFIGFVLLMVYTNALTTMLSLLSLVLYAFAYTPLKRKGPIAVFVGAIPGALPPLLGWVAATGTIGIEGLVIFSIQFFWQFPHFWAIAWVADEDYKKAGFKLLPNGGSKDLNTAIQIMIYTLFLIPLGLLPAMSGMTGATSAVVATICGILFLTQTFSLMKDGSRKSALKIMFGSFFYLPIVQIAYLLDQL